MNKQRTVIGEAKKNQGLRDEHKDEFMVNNVWIENSAA